MKFLILPNVVGYKNIIDFLPQNCEYDILWINRKVEDSKLSPDAQYFVKGNFLPKTLFNWMKEKLDLEKYSGILMSNSSFEKTLAGLLSAEFNLAALGDIEEIVYDEKILFVKSVEDYNVFMSLNNTEKFVVTLAKTFAKDCEEVSFDGFEELKDSKVLNKKIEEIQHTDIVIGVGAGVDKKIMPKVKQLASILKARILGTRPASDVGLIGKNDYIGQSGLTVSGKIYIALGISGAMQHMVGIDKNMYIISINTDENAPIKQFSDEFYNVDVEEFLDKFLEVLSVC